MVHVRWVANARPYVPGEIKESRTGRRPSVERLAGLLDMEDPALAWIANALADMVSAGVEVDEAAIAIATKLGRRRYEAETRVGVPTRGTTASPLRLWPEEGDRESIVYYIRRGDLIKIGTTTNPKRRFYELVPDEILAWEPGGRNEERLRHDRFGHLRQGQGEYFRPGGDLVAHCRSVRKTHGEPDPTWRTAGTVAAASRGLNAALPRAIPVPAFGALVNASQAVELMGVNRNTFGGWVHRGLLKEVDRDARNRPVYYIEHVQVLRDRSKQRQRAPRGAA